MNIYQIYKQFPTQASCIKYLEKTRWKGKPICPYCEGKNVIKKTKLLRHHCIDCNRKFTVLVGTIFHSTKLPLQKWFLAVSTVLNAKKGISSLQLHRELGITQKTAWYLIMRIRKAFKETPEQLSGIIQCDELFIGGKNHNKHKKQREELNKKGTGYVNKIPIFGMIQQDGKIIAFKMNRQPSQATLEPLILRYITKGSTIITDGFGGYANLSKNYTHKIVNHGQD